ncbi:GNAT family N-acetyltransferase [bacterium]|nr:GNAT family N-acetyltransferase [candidate division CSSED10-310 bacterium]
MGGNTRVVKREWSAEDIFEVELVHVQPSQLYLSETKYDVCLKWLESAGFENYEPLPVKRIGNDLFFTDGHTRAYALWRSGLRSIKAIADPDKLDWIQYLANIAWCREAGITSIADLGDRVVSHAEYEQKWYGRCSEWQAALKDNPLRDLTIGFESDPGTRQIVCNEILRALPNWFGIEQAVVDYVNDVRELPFVTAVLYGKVIGFCAIRIHFGINAEMAVLGIFEDFHGIGIGTRLFQFIEEFCRDQRIAIMTVKTLSASHPDPGYAATRRFYEHVGFRGMEEFPTLWGKANPCLYMMKRV